MYKDIYQINTSKSTVYSLSDRSGGFACRYMALENIPMSFRCMAIHRTFYSCTQNECHQVWMHAAKYGCMPPSGCLPPSMDACAAKYGCLPPSMDACRQVWMHAAKYGCLPPSMDACRQVWMHVPFREMTP